MVTFKKIHRDLVAATVDRPHFKSLEQMLPPEVTVTNEGLGLLQSSYHDLEGKTDATSHYTDRSTGEKRRHHLHESVLQRV
jgi:hypothetical protein